MLFKNFWANALLAGGLGLGAGWWIGSMTTSGRNVGWGGGMGGGGTPHGPYNNGNPVWSDYGKKGMYIEGMAAGRHSTGSFGGGMGGGATPHGPYNNGNPVWSDYGKKGMYIEGMAAGRHS